MPILRIYASAHDKTPVCSTLTDDPDCGPVEALDMTRETCVGPELTETAYAEMVAE